jgi:hypothetical protein
MERKRQAGHHRAATEEAILDAVSGIVRDDGFLGLGVNAVAEKAGVSKVLIYRYFGDMDGLMNAWALKNNYWGEGAKGALDGADDISVFAEEVFSGQIRSLRSSKEGREMLRWCLVSDNPLCARIMESIEERGLKTMSDALSIAGSGPEKRLNAGIAIIVGGIYYLSLIADRASVFNGVELGSDADWATVSAAAREMAIGLLSARPASIVNEAKGKKTKGGRR